MPAKNNSNKPSCKTCKSWTEIKKGNGYCDGLPDENFYIDIESDGCGAYVKSIITYKTFCCANFKPKNEK